MLPVPVLPIPPCTRSPPPVPVFGVTDLRPARRPPRRPPVLPIQLAGAVGVPIPAPFRGSPVAGATPTTPGGQSPPPSLFPLAAPTFPSPSPPLQAVAPPAPTPVASTDNVLRQVSAISVGSTLSAFAELVEVEVDKEEEEGECAVHSTSTPRGGSNNTNKVPSFQWGNIGGQRGWSLSSLPDCEAIARAASSASLFLTLSPALSVASGGPWDEEQQGKQLPPLFLPSPAAATAAPAMAPIIVTTVDTDMTVDIM